MKKRLIILFLILSFTLSGCSLFQKDDSDGINQRLNDYAEQKSGTFKDGDEPINNSDYIDYASPQYNESTPTPTPKISTNNNVFIVLHRATGGYERSGEEYYVNINDIISFNRINIEEMPHKYYYTENYTLVRITDNNTVDVRETPEEIMNMISNKTQMGNIEDKIGEVGNISY